jgi:hypothetical protein
MCQRGTALMGFHMLMAVPIMWVVKRQAETRLLFTGQFSFLTLAAYRQDATLRLQ